MPPALSGRGSSGDDTWGRVEAKAGLSPRCAAGTTVWGRVPGVLDHSDYYSLGLATGFFGDQQSMFKGQMRVILFSCLKKILPTSCMARST